MPKLFSGYHSIAIVVLLFLSTSCALKPIRSQMNFIEVAPKAVDLDKLGEGQVLIYNGADILHKIDVTARLNIWINNKALGQLRAGEYVVVYLDPTVYQLDVLHIDVVKMRSNHQVEITKDTKVIKIKPNLTSNKLEITNSLPKHFEKFEYAQSNN